LADYWQGHAQTLATDNLALREALKPFAALAAWIAENRPDYDTDAHEVQIEEWPYTLGVGQLRAAKKALGAEYIAQVSS
jgi:hypothetical protein